MKIKKVVTALILLGMFFSLVLAPIGFAEETNNVATKDKPFPSESENLSRSFSLMAMQEGEIGNDHVRANIGTDGRFSAGLKAIHTSDWYRVIYGGYDGWSGSTGTSFTSLKVDGEDKVFGNDQDGDFITSPTNIDDQTNEAVWKTGDVSVKQVLKSTINPATGIDDSIQVRYTMTNTGNTNHEVGIRIMLDTMVGSNDSAPFKVPTEEGIVSIDYEKEFVGNDVPEFWQAFETFENPQISSHYTMSGDNATPPDRFAIANWGLISDTVWDYQIQEEQQSTGDSAVGMWWNPVTLAPGETKTITTYYGRPGVGGSETLVLSGRQKLTASEWTSEPTNLIAYLNNNTGADLENVRLEIVSSDGITLADNDANHEIGHLPVGDTTQTTWRIQPNTHGVHSVTVKAFEEGDTEPFATSDYEIEALEPVVPPNVSIVDGRGEQEDGTPMASRTSPLTVNASFPDASGVTFIAADSDNNRYEAEMSSGNGADWTHSFVPADEGLWGSPLTIQLIPRFEDGTSGEAQDFQIVLIDPSGVVYNAEQATVPEPTPDEDYPAPLDWALPGATVVLEYFDPALETWVAMNNDAYPGMLSPITNPQITGNDGRYAWDVAEGRYRVVVSRPGFETMTSRVVEVPPPVLNLHVGLTPTDRVKPTLSYEGVTNGETYDSPVSIHLNATDDAAGIRTMSYRVDGGEEVTVNGTSTELAVEETGSHSINVTIMDHAGNERTETIAFTIQEEQSEGDIIAILSQALEKNEEAQQKMKESLAHVDAGDDATDIENKVNIALNSNAEAKELIERAKTLLPAQSLSPTLLTIFEMQLDMAISQNTATNTHLENVLTLLSEESPMSDVRTKLNNALNANKKSKASIQYVASYIVMISRR